jgi:hypothetical protein
MPLVILHHLLNVSVQLANKRGFKKNPNSVRVFDVLTMYGYVQRITYMHHTLDVNFLAVVNDCNKIDAEMMVTASLCVCWHGCLKFHIDATRGSTVLMSVR